MNIELNMIKKSIQYRMTTGDYVLCLILAIDAGT